MCENEGVEYVHTAKICPASRDVRKAPARVRLGLGDFPIFGIFDIFPHIKASHLNKLKHKASHTNYVNFKASHSFYSLASHSDFQSITFELVLM